MKTLLKITVMPVALVLDLLTWICAGLISCSAILFRVASSVLAVLALAVLVTYSVQNGLILLMLAFLASPLGIPMIAVWLLDSLQKISGAIKAM